MSAKEGTPEAERQEEERREKAANERGLVVATWILALVTGLLFLAAAIQAGLFVWQLGYMREGMKDATTAARASKESAETAKLQAEIASGTLQTMRDIAERQLRAYVGISGSSIADVQTGAPMATVIIKNFGQTPAYDVEAWIHLWVAEHPLNEVLPDAPPEMKKAKGTLYPGSTLIFQMPKDPPVKKEYIHLLGTSEGTIYVYGGIIYRDIFNNRRFTKYRLIYGGPHGMTGNLMGNDREGNEAN
ncbi:hypothetical protein [Bradyrhizobium sp. 2S1]|uniref:hypothetical protein n=1 Tax=Bradyrhizobium sp. 2S1 TaxID=1404429 RepID=UPI00140C8E40|nr:hypothetical protein [Bradyrhizobium sp. 2S1]MCK7670838.1 hypothetical protein [Bradyrhizobium sp. 2S1]